MFKHYSHVLALGLCACSLFADEGNQELSHESESHISSSLEATDLSVSLQDTPSIFPTSESKEVLPPAFEPAVQPSIVKAPAPKKVVEKAIEPFTGKVKGRKVRLRVNADTDSRIVKEVSKNDYLLVTGEKGGFYAVEPPAGTKAYVFRSFVLDGVVEGNHVNVRLDPSLESPVIAHLNAGQHVDGIISSISNKWLEITPPEGTHFYIAKEYVERAGGPEIKHQVDKRKTAAHQLMESAGLMAKAELDKPFTHIDIQPIASNYETVIEEYAEFPDLAEKAKEALTSLQENYLQKRLSFLQENPGHILAADPAESLQDTKLEIAASPTDLMKLWEPVEESLYLSWASKNEDRSINEFYEEQKQNATIVSGIVEPYTSAVKRKPGNFVLRDKELPVAYLYSTHINLQEYVGKKVTVIAAPRANNNFAFPAYYVLSVE